MVRCHPDVERLQQARFQQAGLDARQLFIHGAQGGDRRGMSDAVCVRGGVGVAEPQDGHRRIDPFQSHVEQGVDDVAVAAAVGHGGGRRRAEPLLHGVTERRGQRVVVVDDAASGHRVVQQERRTGRAGAGHQQPPAGILQALAERRRREQPPAFGALDPQQVVPLARAEEARGVDVRKEDRVAEQAVRLGIGAGGYGRRVDPRHRRVDRVVAGEHDSPLAERVQVRHQLRRHVVRPQAVEDDQQVAVPPPLRPLRRGLLGRTATGAGQPDDRDGQRRRLPSAGHGTAV